MKIVTDSGTGLTSDPTVVVLAPVADTGKGVETVLASALLAVLDYGTGVEFLIALSTINVEDLGHGLDLINIFRRFLVEDENIAVLEQIHDVAVIIPVVDTGKGTEFIVIFQSVLITDTAYSVDEFTTLSYIVIEDEGTGVDEIEEVFMYIGQIEKDSYLEYGIRGWSEFN